MSRISLGFQITCICSFLAILEFPRVTGCDGSCAERISDSYNYNSSVKIINDRSSPNIVYPQNTISYVVENRTLTTFFVAAIPENYNNGLCNLRAFENDCLATNNYCSNRDLKLYHEEGQQILNYTLSNFNISLDGTRIDICARCTSLYECFPPVYLSVKDRPVISTDIISVKLLCSGIELTGHIDSDTELHILIKELNNVTIFKETIQKLPYFINGTQDGNMLNPHMAYTLFLTGENPAGTSKTVVQNISFQNFANFDIEDKNVNIKIIDDRPMVTINLTVNDSCLLSSPWHIRTESNCIFDGYIEIAINEENILKLMLLQGKKKCTLTVSSGRTTKIVNINITVANVSFSTCKNGHFETHVNLLPGATGIVIRLFDSKKTFVVQQKIHRNDQDSILMNNSKKLDPGNYTIKIHYLNKDGSFDTLSNITNDHTLHCTLEDDESSTPTTNITDSNDLTVIIVVILIVLAVLVILIIAIPIIVIVVLVRRNKGSFKVKQKRSSQIFKVKFFPKTDILKISQNGQNGKTIETEVRAGDQEDIESGEDTSHSTAQLNTESPPKNPPYPPQSYPTEYHPSIPTDTTDTCNSSKPLLGGKNGSSVTSPTATSASANITEMDPLLPTTPYLTPASTNNRKSPKSDFAIPKQQLPPSQTVGGYGVTRDQPPPHTTVIPKPQKISTIPGQIVVPAPRKGITLPQQKETQQLKNQDTGTGRSAYVFGGNAKETPIERKGKEEEKDMI